MAPRHGRVLVALGVGGIFAAVSGGLRSTLGLSWDTVALLFTDVVFATYLLLTFRYAYKTDAAMLRRHAATADEGTWLIVGLAVVVVIVSLGTIFRIVTGTGAAEPVFALIAVPLGWALVHSLAAFHYAHLFYSPGVATPGLLFPGDKDPEAWDFLYFAFGIGMTAQVSDVVTTTPVMRKVVTFHAMASFFYNTIILALAVNAAITAGS